MGGALDQAGAGVEELVRLPFQADATVRATVLVSVDPAFAAHGKDLLPGDLEATAAGIDQFGAGTKKLHDYPQVPKTLACGGYVLRALVSKYVRA